MLSPLGIGDLHRDVPVVPLRRGCQHRARQRAGARTTLDDREVVGLADAVELGVDPPRQHGAEQWTDFW